MRKRRSATSIGLMNSVNPLVVMTLMSALLLSCTKKDSGPAREPRRENATPEAAAYVTDQWVGRWSGPEGTYLDVAGGNGHYQITVKDLDRARTFQGSSVDDRIEFQRDGANESLRHSNGNETGMKWLAGKADCLTVKPGEGYCRD